MGSSSQYPPRKSGDTLDDLALVDLAAERLWFTSGWRGVLPLPRQPGISNCLPPRSGVNDAVCQ